ncbi:MAG: transcriptional repressor [Roseicyclus sp.]
MTSDPQTGAPETGASGTGTDDAQAAPGFAPHDHAACVATALAAAEARSAAEGLRLTPVRRKVLEILVQEHRALGAYALLDRLREAGFGSQPPVAYRALEFLTRHGFAHKIERLNAFVACSHPGPRHAPAFMICRVCDAVAEAQADPGDGALSEAAEAVGFRIEKTVMEAEGVCPACRETDAGASPGKAGP